MAYILRNVQRRNGIVKAQVTALALTPIKGLRLQARSEVMLTERGVIDNRCFFLIDERGRMVNGKRLGALASVRADYDPERAHLRVSFPDGTVLAGEVCLGEAVPARFFSQAMTARTVAGPFSKAFSEFAGQELRLVHPDQRMTAIDRGVQGAVSLVSQASVRRLSELGGVPVDARRFRMLVEVNGLGAHEEDQLVGSRARIGEALVAVHGHVGRCLVTGQHPETGVQDLPTLELLSYRRELPTTEPLAVGVYGEVLEPGTVRLGDAVCEEP